MTALEPSAEAGVYTDDRGGVYLDPPTEQHDTEPPRSSWLAGAPMDPAAVAPEPLPTIPGFPYMHAGAGAVVVGPTGGGRSSLVQAGAYDAARSGLRVAYLGSEVTEGEFNARAADLATRRGDTIDSDLRGQLAEARYLSLASIVTHAWEHRDAWAHEMPRHYDGLVVDPLSAVASTLDLDFDKSNAEFVKFYDRLVQPLVNAGMFVVLLENVGHAQEARHRAKGASAKSDRADLTFSCALQSHPEQALIITAHKVRTIRAPFQRGTEWIFDRETQRIEPRERGEQPAAFRPTVLMERVSRALEAEPGLSRRALRAAVKGRNDAKELALDLLVAEEYAERRTEGQAVRHYSTRPFRDDEDAQQAPTVPTVPEPCPDRAPGTVETHRAHRAPCLTRGTGTGHGSNGTPGTANRAPAPEADLHDRADALEARYGDAAR